MNSRTGQHAVRVGGQRGGGGGRHLFASAGIASLLAIAAASGSAATPAVELKPDLGHIPALAEVAKDVGVRYPAEFRNYTLADRFALGPASVRVLDSVFQKVFRRTVELKEDKTSVDPPIDVVIVPSIHDVSVNASPPLAGRWWFVWCHLTYRFTISSPVGEKVTAWDVTGSKETLGDLRAETLVAAGARALTRCVEDAGIRFMRSFYDVPEAARWVRSQKLDEANASLSAQLTETAGEGDKSSVVGLYRGVARVQVQAHADTDLGFKVAVENLSAHRLLIGRADIALQLSDGTRLSPAPVYAFAAARLPGDSTTPYFHIPPPPISLAPSYFAMANLISMLIVMDSMATEQQALDSHLEKHRGEEFGEKRLAAGASVSGDVYFGGPPKAIVPPGSFLSLPIVDLDTAKRYEVRLPIRQKGGTSR